ncbi:hypothetical protein LINGRAHAP2_LOCUS31093 [Linum grandiflorum]
MVSLSSTP